MTVATANAIEHQLIRAAGSVLAVDAQRLPAGQYDEHPRRRAAADAIAVGIEHGQAIAGPQFLQLVRLLRPRTGVSRQDEPAGGNGAIARPVAAHFQNRSGRGNGDLNTVGIGPRPLFRCAVKDEVSHRPGRY